MVQSEGTAKEVSLEWSLQTISSTDLKKVRVTH